MPNGKHDLSTGFRPGRGYSESDWAEGLVDDADMTDTEVAAARARGPGIGPELKTLVDRLAERRQATHKAPTPPRRPREPAAE